MSKVIDPQIAELHWNNGLLDKEIAAKMGLSPGAVGNWRKRNGLPSNVGIFRWDKGERTEDVTRRIG